MKILRLLLFLLLYSAGINAQSEKNNSDMRGTIIEISETNFRYDYYDIYEKDSHLEYLDQKGYQGGGPSWEGIIWGVLKIKTPAILEQIEFDAEGEGLAIWCNKREPLEEIAKLVAEVKMNDQLLNEAIKIAEESGIME